MSKLNSKIIEKILKYKGTGVTQCEIAKKFKISQPMVSYILTGKYIPVCKPPRPKTKPKQKLLPEVLFWTKVIKRGTKKTSCWEWVGSLDYNGYGLFWANSQTYFAHRFSAQLAGHKIKGKVVRHCCDNPRCIRPSHLIPGTHADNVRDMVVRHRTNCGINVCSAKLNPQKVRFIRGSLLTTSKLANKYKVNEHTIRCVRKYKTWKHVK